MTIADIAETAVQVEVAEKTTPTILQRSVSLVKRKLDQLLEHLNTTYYVPVDTSAYGGWNNRYWQIRSLREGHPNCRTSDDQPHYDK